MQAPRRQNVEVVIPVNGYTHAYATNGTPNRRVRPLSVDEALQYSPFTTSVSAGHGTALAPTLGGLRLTIVDVDRIPVPQIGQANSHYSLTTSAERKTVRRSLQEIGHNSTKDHNGPKFLQDVGHEVDKHLDGEALSELYVVSSP